jgi:hypothetical protein
MSPRDLSGLCDPEKHSKETALEMIKSAAARDEALHLKVARILREQCTAARPNLNLIGRTLDVLDTAASPRVFIALVRPILRDCDPQVQSKCVLMLARRETDLLWAYKLLESADPRLRANVVEGFWENNSPGVRQFFERASRDSHHRVVGNAAYGLRLQKAPEFDSVLERMHNSPDPMFRHTLTWLIGKIAEPDLFPLLKLLIRDADPAVRSGAFLAVASLRPRG